MFVRILAYQKEYLTLKTHLPRLIIVLSTVLLVSPLSVLRAQNRPSYADKIGLELEGLGDGGRSMPFVDLAKTLRGFVRIGSSTVAPTDANGWAMSDCATVLFDIRPFGAWSPPIDDPDKYQPDWSGVYKLLLTGKADITNGEGNNQIVNLRYDATRNTTTADVVIPQGSGLLVLKFTNTRRTPSAPTDTGFTNLRIIRPNYPANTAQVFTNEFLRSLKPFKVLRYMDWLDTNHQPGFYGDVGHHALEWQDRRTMLDASQSESSKRYGVAWEYVIALANETGKDAWIDIPVAATDDYIRQLAKLLKKSLKPEIRLYIEHSNEVWNFGFPQYIYNKLAAIEEGKSTPTSNLNNDGVNDQERWAHRRHAKRLYTIAQIFKQEFGADSFLKRVRPVYASWLISPDAHFKDVLKWLSATYGAPKDYFWAMAGAAYYNAERASLTASPTEIVEAMRQCSIENGKYHRQLKTTADSYGLQYVQYEVGPDNGGGKVENVANRIRANRISAMKDLVLFDSKNWFTMGGGLYMYFASPSAYSRYGCWGLSEDIRQLNTPKWQAIYELTGTAPPK